MKGVGVGYKESRTHDPNNIELDQESADNWSG